MARAGGRLYNPEMPQNAQTPAAPLAAASAAGDALPSVRVVIPARNAETTLRECLRSVMECDYPRKTIWIVNDGSRDTTAAILGEFPGINVLHVRAMGASAARNLAMQNAAEDVIAFTDADCVVRKDWLRRLVACVMEPGVSGAGGPQLAVPHQPLFARRIHAFLAAICFVGDYMRVGQGKHPVQHIPSCNSAYRREAILSVGGFRPGLFPGEDVDLDRRLIMAGHKLVYTPEAVVEHHRPESLSEYVRMCVGYGLAQGQLVRLHGPFRLLHVLPAIAAAAVAAWVALLIANPSAAALTAAAAGLALLAALARRIEPPLNLPWFVMLLLVTVPAWNIGFLLGLLAGFKDIPWSNGGGASENEDTAHQRP